MLGSFDKIGFALRRRFFFDHKAQELWDGQGKAVIITGPTSGSGGAAALGLAEGGAELHLVIRNRAKGAALANEIKGRAPRATIHFYYADLSSARQVLEAVTNLKKAGPFWALINNAGIMIHSREITEDDYEQTFAVNTLAPYILTKALANSIMDRGRIIQVSSGGMYLTSLQTSDIHFTERDYSGLTAYAESKRAEVVMSEWFAGLTSPDFPEEVRASTGPLYLAMHPGWVATDAVRQGMPIFHRLTRSVLRSPKAGADTILWLVFSPAYMLRNGGFYFDRKRRPAYRFGYTKETPDQRSQFMDYLDEQYRRLVKKANPKVKQDLGIKQPG